MINYTGGTTVDDILFFEPPYQTPGTGNPSLPNQGATQMNTWQSWNALVGGWWDDTNAACGTEGSGVESLASCITMFPNAVIVNTAGGLGGVRFNVGFASPNDQFNGYVDSFTIGINGVNTTFDFDPDSAASVVPEPATLALFGAGLAGLAAMRRRKAKKSA